MWVEEVGEGIGVALGQYDKKLCFRGPKGDEGSFDFLLAIVRDVRSDIDLLKEKVRPWPRTRVVSVVSLECSLVLLALLYFPVQSVRLNAASMLACLMELWCCIGMGGMKDNFLFFIEN